MMQFQDSTGAPVFISCGAVAALEQADSDWCVITLVCGKEIGVVGRADEVAARVEVGK